ncbi:hypothetical protein SDC9_127816 [bioreactor metagenome]|uniref:Uncharacterized protein n=1 Tax=bioreactor metagenome TaxID=1076179 RepID=A0A645CUG6_9ZZZZ|nr:hypothetical protein [Lutispora sp.]MEA4961917.1 hypothetical protein [Lutispora sp.]HCJ58023.1 hypothetical protein [Clostridiaceae bacterium]
MKKYAYKCIGALLFIVVITFLYSRVTDLATALTVSLIFTAAIFITDYLYRLNNKICNIALIIITTISFSIAYKIVSKELSMFNVVIYAIFSMVLYLIARSESIKKRIT